MSKTVGNRTLLAAGFHGRRLCSVPLKLSEFWQNKMGYDSFWGLNNSLVGVEPNMQTQLPSVLWRIKVPMTQNSKYHKQLAVHSDIMGYVFLKLSQIWMCWPIHLTHPTPGSCLRPRPGSFLLNANCAIFQLLCLAILKVTEIFLSQQHAIQRALFGKSPIHASEVAFLVRRAHSISVTYSDPVLKRTHNVLCHDVES